MRILTIIVIIFALLGALLAFAVFNLNGLVNKNKGVVIYRSWRDRGKYFWRARAFS